MKNLKLSIYTSLVFILVFIATTVFTMPLIVKQFTISILENTYQGIEKQSSTISYVYQEKESQNRFNEIAQEIIGLSREDTSHLSIIDWTGNIVCHPNVTNIGEKLSYDKAVDFGDNPNATLFYDTFFTYFNNLAEGVAGKEIVNLQPIKDSDLLIVYHLNLKEIIGVVSVLKRQVFFSFLIIGLLVWILILTIVRVIQNNSDKIVEEKINTLENNAQNLAKLNESLNNYQEKLVQREIKEQEERNKQKELLASAEKTESASNVEVNTVTAEEVSKLRILSYVRNELVTTLVTDIAYIYVENTITYIVSHEGRKTTSSDSLDKIYSMLRKELFFKANRQFIVAISAIEKITKYENSKLKIQVKPKSEIDIIIGKNKAAAFKQWLDL